MLHAQLQYMHSYITFIVLVSLLHSHLAIVLRWWDSYMSCDRTFYFR